MEKLRMALTYITTNLTIKEPLGVVVLWNISHGVGLCKVLEGAWVGAVQ